MENALNNPCPDSVSGVSAHLFLTLLNALMASKCRITDPQNYPPNLGEEVNDEDEYDFIVIGAGSAGSVVANKLSENGKWKVLVLEAGGRPTSDSEIPALLFSIQGTHMDWQYTVEPSEKACLGFKDQRCRWPRGKCLGGSSSINANLYIRGNKKDYDQWAKQGNEGWDYDSVLKYFHELEDLQVEELQETKRYSRGGFLPLNLYHSTEPIGEIIKQSAQILGYPTVMEEENFGFFDAIQTIQKNVRANAAKAFLGKAQERPNLKVATDAFVEKIIIENKKAVGVLVNISGRKLRVKAKKEIVVSSGAINSPQLLMLSGIGPKQHLQSLGIHVEQNLAVGENLQDHVMFYGLDIKVSNDALSDKSRAVDELYKYFMYNEGALGQIGITNLVGFINTRNDSNYPNVQMHHIVFDQNDPYLLPEITKVIGIAPEYSSVELKANQKSPIMKILPTLLNPKSKGKILLRSTNPLDKPLIYANYLEDTDDVETILEGIQFVLKQLRTEPFQKVNPEILNLNVQGCESHQFKSDDYYRCAIRRLTTTVYHPVGTCKMGPKSDTNAVVDLRLRVHGIANLRVIDASIMPDIVSVNTNAPTLMIGMKGATMIIEDWTHVHDDL